MYFHRQKLLCLHKEATEYMICAEPVFLFFIFIVPQLEKAAGQLPYWEVSRIGIPSLLSTHLCQAEHHHPLRTLTTYTTVSKLARTYAAALLPWMHQLWQTLASLMKRRRHKMFTTSIREGGRFSVSNFVLMNLLILRLLPILKRTQAVLHGWDMHTDLLALPPPIRWEAFSLSPHLFLAL